jgi:hypothetical protein
MYLLLQLYQGRRAAGLRPGLPAGSHHFQQKIRAFETGTLEDKKQSGQVRGPYLRENEVGGTSWLYLSSEPFETVGFPKLGTKAPPRLTESIQHGLFQYFAVPIILYGVLGGIMGLTGYLKSAKEDLKSTTVEKGDRQ